VVRADEEIYCEDGAIPLGRHVIRDSHPYGVLTLADVIAKSSNIGALKVGTRLGAGPLHDLLTTVGFGSKSGVELPGEVAGILPQSKSWSKARLATVSFGQGISVTALQMSAAIAAIANNGILRQPFVVDRVVANDGHERASHPASEGTRVFSSKSARVVTEMMELVVKPGGTGARAALPGLRVAGKTGTAQKVDPVAGGYSVDKRIASFVGFAPAEAPKVLALVVIDEPQGSTYGGVVAAPAFREIVGSTLMHLGISVGAPEQLAKSNLPSVLPDASVGGINVQSPRFDIGSTNHTVVPDLRGLDIRRATAAALSTGLELHVEGRGRVIEQEPAPGTSLDGAPTIRLLLQAGRS
jgi:cell division protein FtsI (penicillin-binding protein 3)